MKILKSPSYWTLSTSISLTCIILLLSLGCQPNSISATRPSASPSQPVPSTSPPVTTPGIVTVPPVVNPPPTNPDVVPAPITNSAPTPGVVTPPLPTATADNDHDGIDDTIEDQLIQRFAPVIRFHSEEQYLLANIPWYLQRVRMRFDVRRGLDDNILNKGITITSLISQKNRNQVSGLSANPSDFFLEQTDINGGNNLDAYRKETRKGAGRDGWIIYVHVRPAPADTHSGMYDIQYIFFYAYNGDMLYSKAESAHEADFEHITVRVKSDLKTIYQIYYSAHDNEGKWYGTQTAAGKQDGYSVTSDGRPIVYSAINSHASYPWAGRQSRGKELPDDATSNGGTEWDSRQNVVNLGEKAYPRNGMEWIQYSGRWGEMGDTSFTTGPTGPAYQGWWDKDLE